VEMPLVAARYCLAGVVAVVEAQHGARTLDGHREAVVQVAMADIVVISKCDLAPAQAVEALDARVRAMNPGARSLRFPAQDIGMAALLETGLHRGGGRIADAGGWLRAGAYRH